MPFNIRVEVKKEKKEEKKKRKGNQSKAYEWGGEERNCILLHWDPLARKRTSVKFLVNCSFITS